MFTEPEPSWPRPSESKSRQSSMSDSSRQIVLMKKGQRFVFRYDRGKESKILSHLAELARDSSSDLDWFDVAVLSHQVGQQMGKQFQQMMSPK